MCGNDANGLSVSGSRLTMVAPVGHTGSCGVTLTTSENVVISGLFLNYGKQFLQKQFGLLLDRGFWVLF